MRDAVEGGAFKEISLNLAFTELQHGHVFVLFSALLPFVGCGFCGLMII